MKKLLVSIFILVILILIIGSLEGCSDKRSSSDLDGVDSVDIDSANRQEMEDILSSIPMTKSAEVLFNDFLFNFAGNSKFQKQRIIFPLPVTSNGKEVMLTADKWQIERFFLRQELYTVFFDSQKDLTLMRDTSVNNVVVEKINLNKNIVKQFKFIRKNREWRMTGINYCNISETPSASFFTFYKNFSTDSLYQMKSLSEAIEFSGPDPDDELSSIEGTLIPEQWVSFAPPLPKGTIYNIIYGKPQKKSNQKIMLIQGVSNGYLTELVFKNRKGKWYLTRLQI